MNDCPDSPEAVALVLLEKILEREAPQRNDTSAAQIIELYAQCLAAVHGKSHESRVFH
jgi:hypothetical protein